jgi:hypothetical protein
MGRRTRLLKVPKTAIAVADTCADDPWWLATIMPDLTWARNLLAEKERKRGRAMLTLAILTTVPPWERIRLW